MLDIYLSLTHNVKLNSASVPFWWCSSHAEVTVANRCRLHNIIAIHSPVPPLLPEHCRSNEGVLRGTAQRATSFFTLRFNGKNLKCWLSIISLCYKKIIDRCLKLLVWKYHPNPTGSLGDILEKAWYSTELKPIAHTYCARLEKQCQDWHALWAWGLYASAQADEWEHVNHC